MQVQWNKVTWYSKALALAIFVALPFVGFYLGIQYDQLNGVVMPQSPTRDPRNSAYTIDGRTVVLLDGKAEMQIAPNSAMKEIVQYFGNGAIGDLNGDGIKDSAFYITENSGGTGTFYYIAALLSSNGGYRGTNAILLGDRIAPQGVEIQNGKIIANYADRKPNEPMSSYPSIGVSRTFQVKDGTLSEIR